MTPAATDLIDGFITWLTHNRGRALSTAQKYRKALELLVDYLAGRDLLEANDDDLVLFTGLWLHRRGVAARARRSYVAAVRGFYKWTMVQRRGRHNPAAALNYPAIGRPLPMVITLEHYEKLMSAPDLNTFEGVRDAAMLALLGGCGIRVSGLVRLNVGDVTRQNVDDVPRTFIRVHEKGNKTRVVPVPREAELQLRVYMEHEALKEIDRSSKGGDQVLFVTTRNRRCPPHLYRGERRRFSRQSVNSMLLRYGGEQKIPRGELHPHALRHLFGTELAEADVDMLVLQELMGHVDPKSTAIYTHLAMRKMVREVDRGGPLAKIRTSASDLLRSMRSAAPPRSPTKPSN